MGRSPRAGGSSGKARAIDDCTWAPAVLRDVGHALDAHGVLGRDRQRDPGRGSQGGELRRGELLGHFPRDHVTERAVAEPRIRRGTAAGGRVGERVGLGRAGHEGRGNGARRQGGAGAGVGGGVGGRVQSHRTVAGSTLRRPGRASRAHPERDDSGEEAEPEDPGKRNDRVLIVPERAGSGKLGGSGPPHRTRRSGLPVAQALYWPERCIISPRSERATVTTEHPRALIVDDEPNIRSTLAVCLESIGCEVHAAAGAREAIAVVERRPFDIAFVDVRLGSADGMALLPEMLRLSPQLAVVIITAYASIESAIQAIKAGAQDYLPKPFTPAQIRIIVDRFRQRMVLENQVANLEGILADAAPEVLIDTASTAMQRAIDTVTQAATADTAVLLRGESGTGKGVLARLLHARSRRAARRLVTVNCPTLSDELLTSELFGHVRGAFTGAVRDRRGKVEEADGGTLFLDEIGEISPALQAKLLRFAQDREFEPVGDPRTRRADVRLVAATNQDLPAAVEAGRFRLDLFYRLNVIEILVPPLRERREDLLRLARHFLAFVSRDVGRRAPGLGADAEALLVAYPWPGNVRELKNEMERAVVLSREDVLGPESFSDRMRGGAERIPHVGGDFSLAEIEQEHTLRVLARAATREEAARILGIDPSTLWRRLKRYEQGGGEPEG